MTSTLRNDTRRALALERLAKAGDKRADLTLGQLLAGALDGGPDLRTLSDTELVEAVERFVLLDPGGEGQPPRP
jgi:hypothetical protein